MVKSCLWCGDPSGRLVERRLPFALNPLADRSRNAVYLFGFAARTNGAPLQIAFLARRVVSRCYVSDLAELSGRYATVTPEVLLSNLHGQRDSILSTSLRSRL